MEFAELLRLRKAVRNYLPDGDPKRRRRARSRAPGAMVALVARLAAAEIGATFNQYAESATRRKRLVDHLEQRLEARLLLVGEAAGYRGARISGVPFTSERQLSGSGPAEATATIVHRALAELDLAEQVLLWNVVPTHPHRPGDPRSNRQPTRSEVEGGLPFLRELARGRRAIAVGRLAQAVVGGPYVRHPSHGGAREFRTALASAVRERRGGGLIE